MNQKKAKSLRSQCVDRKTYQRLKKQVSAQALTNASQHPKPKKQRKHKQKELIAPTWPHTKNQRKQRRPVIVMRPIRALKKKSEILFSPNAPEAHP
jgi:hypothetical protein